MSLSPPALRTESSSENPWPRNQTDLGVGAKEMDKLQPLTLERAEA